MIGKPLIAIDLGSSAVKVVELSGGSQKKLRAIGLELLPNGAVLDGAINDPESVQRVVRDLLKKLKISARGRRAAVSLGGSAVSVKKIVVPVGSEEDLGEQVFYEAEQHFQQDMADI